MRHPGKSVGQAMESKPLERGIVGLHAPGVRQAIVKSKLEQLTEEKRERYVLDNVEQSEKLAEELQCLVGRRYFDDESGHLKVQGSNRVLYWRRESRGRTQ